MRLERLVHHLVGVELPRKAMISDNSNPGPNPSPDPRKGYRQPSGSGGAKRLLGKVRVATPKKLRSTHARSTVPIRKTELRIDTETNSRSAMATERCILLEVRQCLYISNPGGNELMEKNSKPLRGHLGNAG